MSALCFDRVHIRYGDNPAVRGVSFVVEPGEIVSIIGPNGSGKSTLLKAAAKLVPLYSGTISIGGEDIRSISFKALACRVAMLLQINRAPEDLTVRELVRYGRLPHKRWFEGENEEDARAVARALADTAMEPLSHKRLGELSGGERQRAWLAAALAQEPDILLLDEPTTYLDIRYQLELLERVGHLNRARGLTVVMVLHDLNQAAAYSHRVALLQKGHLVSIGCAEDVLTPETLREVFGIRAECFHAEDGARYLIPHPIVHRHSDMLTTGKEIL